MSPIFSGVTHWVPNLKPSNWHPSQSGCGAQAQRQAAWGPSGGPVSSHSKWLL